MFWDTDTVRYGYKKDIQGYGGEYNKESNIKCGLFALYSLIEAVVIKKNQNNMHAALKH